METSTKMDTHGRWKWINKAAQKFIRYDLPVNSNLAIVTFSNDSKVEHSMVQVHSDQVSKIFVFLLFFSFWLFQVHSEQVSNILWIGFFRMQSLLQFSNYKYQLLYRGSLLSTNFGTWEKSY